MLFVRSLTLLLLYVAIASVAAAQTPTDATAVAASTVSGSLGESAEEKPVHNAAAVEKAVRAAFSDNPAMVAIARCESKFRQYTDSGNVFRGGYGNNMIGVFQFNGPVHTSIAKQLGFDIETLAGNLAYAAHLYKQSGTDPWISSFSCWNTAATETSKNTAFTNLVFGQTHPDVRLLQRRLNEAGFRIAEVGPGSPGNETDMFGSLTRTALRRFQCAAEIMCRGDEHSTGYGLYNEETHAALLAYKPPARLSAVKRAELLSELTKLLELVADLQKKLALLRNA